MLTVAVIKEINREKLPILIMEKILDQDQESEEYESIISNIYVDLFQKLRFRVSNQSIILYNSENNVVEFNIQVKKEFIDVVNKVNAIMIEFNLCVRDFLQQKLIDYTAIRATYDKDVTKKPEVITDNRPLFNILSSSTPKTSMLMWHNSEKSHVSTF